MTPGQCPVARIAEAQSRRQSGIFDVAPRRVRETDGIALAVKVIHLEAMRSPEICAVGPIRVKRVCASEAADVAFGRDGIQLVARRVVLAVTYPEAEAPARAEGLGHVPVKGVLRNDVVEPIDARGYA